uniref:Uncharacterized protein n=1 Tax=Hyaloperonospora arabidopsidis (strain Emoy2) TaxID=559515 RepID=M4BC66_HYAAE
MKARNRPRLWLVIALDNEANWLSKVQHWMLLEILSLVKSSDGVNLSVAYLNQVETLVTAENESLAGGRVLLLAVAHV